MSTSWTLLRVRGIPVRLHVSLAIGLPYFALVSMASLGASARSLGIDPATLALPGWLAGLALAVGLFVCVTLHELAHAAVATRLGGKVTRITLHLLGGVSAVERLPQGTWGEGLMSAAGPAASLALGLGFLAGVRLATGVDLRLLCMQLAEVNLVLAVFNLIPAFPLDGGRVLRSLLRVRWGEERATRIAVAVGRVLAVLMAGFGLIESLPLLVLIAVFIYLAAGAEEARPQVPPTPQGIRVGQVVVAPSQPIAPGASLDALERRLLAEGESGLLVVDEDEEVIGAVGLTRLLEVHREVRAQTRVAEIMAAPLPHVTAPMLLEAAIRHMDRLRVELLPVIEDDRLIGVVKLQPPRLAPGLLARHPGPREATPPAELQPE